MISTKVAQKVAHANSAKIFSGTKWHKSILMEKPIFARRRIGCLRIVCPRNNLRYHQILTGTPNSFDFLPDSSVEKGMIRYDVTHQCYSCSISDACFCLSRSIAKTASSSGFWRNSRAF